MRLIKKLDRRLNKNGNRYETYGLFLCPYCLQEVEKFLSSGKRQKSCGCVKGSFISEANKKRECTEETRKKQSRAKKGKKLTEEHKENIRIKSKGRKQTEEAKQKIKEGNRGKIVSEESKQKNSNSHKGKKASKETIQKMSDKRKMNKNPNWNGGSSFEPYSPEFNKELKQLILERNNYKCQNPNCDGNHKKLHVHHIDYDKTNNDPKNLITLGVSCHAKTNGKNNRTYWTEFYQNIMENKLNVI